MDTDYIDYELLIPYGGDGTKLSILCVAACNAHEYGLFTSVPTVKRISPRHFFAVSASCQPEIYVRDLTKAFVTRKTLFRRAG